MHSGVGKGFCTKVMIKIIRKPVHIIITGGSSPERSGDADETYETDHEHAICDQCVHDTPSVDMDVVPPHEYLRIIPSVERGSKNTHTLPD